jgi:pimeloyl-ACP methyl ester carboxylesterase
MKGMKNIELIVRSPKTAPRYQVPILCVHGGYHGAWCWDEYFLPYFAEHGFEAYALSLRGHGKSDGHENINQWRIADYVADVAAVVEKLPAAPVLIGHSLGGVVVQKYLQQASAPGGILLASSPLNGMATASFKMMLRHPAPILKMFFTFNMLHARPAFETIFFSDDLPRDQVKSYFDRMGNESFWAFMDVAMLDKPNPKEVRSPILVIGGEKDNSIPTAVNEVLASAYGIKLETFPVAHDMMLDPNWKLVADCIVAWTQKQLSSQNAGEAT